MFDSLIDAAENKWLIPVLEHVSALFQGHWMPSHDIDHHRRVWRNVRRLLRQTGVRDALLYEELLLASFFHDVGLIYDPSVRHGKMSRSCCEEFLQSHSGLLTFMPERLLEAIELHDDKEYQLKADHNKVYAYLTVGDDQDALGALGLYRYIEIYLLRGLPEQVIPERIIQNAAGRYAKIEQLLRTWNIDPQNDRTRFELLERLIHARTYDESRRSLIHWIREEVIRKRSDPFSLFRDAVNRENENQRIQAFLLRIQAELKDNSQDSADNI